MKTTSRELSEKLVALGVEIESYFYHHEGGLINKEVHVVYGCTPAPTACELMEVLKRVSHADIGKAWVACGFGEPICVDAYALAIMLIWLIEEGHLTVEEINANNSR